MKNNVYIYILVMGLVTNAIRIVPILLVKSEIKNNFIKSFLYYVPYITLAVMTFPAIIEATLSPVVGLVAMIVGIVIAWKGANLITVAGVCCVIVYILELIL